MNFLLKIIRNFNLNRNIKKMTKYLESEALDLFLETILKIMKIFFLLDKGYRKNITNFDARYAFKSKNGGITASVIFKNSKMTVKKSVIENTNVIVIFKDGKALKELLFSENPDIIGAILDNSVSYNGNLNYLAKFAFMAKHLQLRFSF